MRASAAKYWPMVVLIVVLLPLLAQAQRDNGKGFKDLRLDSTMEVKRLEELERFVDDTARQQLEVMDNIVTRIGSFVDTIVDVGRNVKRTTEDWIKNPTPQHEARVTQAVVEGARRGQKAAAAMASIKPDIQKGLQTLRSGLNTQLRETQGVVVKARGNEARLKAELATAEAAVLETKRLLGARGHFASGEIPPDLEDRLFRLVVDYQEVAMVVDLWRDVAVLIQEYVGVLEYADRDYAQIDRKVDMMAYQAESAARVFGHVGVAETLKVRAKLIADAYGKAQELNSQVTSAFDKLRELRKEMLQLVDVARHLPRPTQPGQQETTAKPMSRSELIAWFEHFEPSQDGVRARKAKVEERNK